MSVSHCKFSYLMVMHRETPKKVFAQTKNPYMGVHFSCGLFVYIYLYWEELVCGKKSVVFSAKRWLLYDSCAGDIRDVTAYLFFC